jgi:hypothetical protein
MKFDFIGEGLTDHIVIKNLLIGFFNDKNLIVNRLLPQAKEPGGWGRVLKYLPTDEFKTAVQNTDYMIIQIDTAECGDWGEGIKHCGADDAKILGFIEEVKTVLIKKIGKRFFASNENKMLFAISVHDIECWLLPFNSTQKSQHSKAIGCVNALEKISNKLGFSLHQKHYKEGKFYSDFAKDMKKKAILLAKSKLNPSLKVFIETLQYKFPLH